MQLIGPNTLLSATDLSLFLGCGHLSRLDLQAAHGLRPRLDWQDPALEILKQRGREHEDAFLAHLKSQGVADVLDLRDLADKSDGGDKTRAAMRAGVDVIVQASLAEGVWRGRADFLRRVEGRSQLGDYHYEVIDAKLARETRGGMILQLCLYSDLLRGIQDVLPESMYVVSPGDPFEENAFRVLDYMAFFRRAKAQLESVAARNANMLDTYPDPCGQCDICGWWIECRRQWVSDDHLSLIAGISRSQRAELEGRGIRTLAACASMPLPLKRPKRGSVESLTRVREQARVQFEGRTKSQPVVEILPPEPDKGFALLPEPSDGDVYFDIEGDPYVGMHGLEYLFGYAYRDGNGLDFEARWALSPDDEIRVFETFVDWVMERWNAHPNMHIYHFHVYEPVALKRLMGRYATREDEIDRMLRAGLFVDLHRVVKGAMLASVEKYSIKDLEIFFGFPRKLDLREASQQKHILERALEIAQPDSILPACRDAVLEYNRDDCASNAALHEWLETLRAAQIEAGANIARPTLEDGTPSESLREEEQAIRELMDRILADLPHDPDQRDEAQQARWLVAQMLEWHRREDKAYWWELHRLKDAAVEDLIEEKFALGGLSFIERVGKVNSLFVDRYSFPRQFGKIDAGDELKDGVDKFGEVVSIDNEACTIDIKKPKKRTDDHASTVFVHDFVRKPAIRAALREIGEWVADNDIDGGGKFRAVRDLLMRRAPRLLSGKARPLRRKHEEVPAAAARVALDLDQGVLAIQGPPGSGKTFTGALMIHALVDAGKTVGVTANSHKVIRNLLDKVVEEFGEGSVPLSIAQKPNRVTPDYDGPIRESTSPQTVAQWLLDGEVQVVGATAWFWAREDLREAVDVLIVDEAGQMSLANVMACGTAAKSIVLLGDPQQLEQPIQGSHPEGTDVAALEHFLGEHETMPNDLGLFLDRTWRLHPKICEFTSELFYEGKLKPMANNDRQAILGDTPFAGAGLFYVPVNHKGNTSDSPQEAEVIKDIVEALLDGNVRWSNWNAEIESLTSQHILIVAPYNDQVDLIGETLPDVPVGTVDRFQGQQAPVVIVSMTTSSPEDAPRGMDFLYNLSRLNVASSRARCVCILVAAPALLEPACRTPKQMRLANGFARFLELATEVDFNG